MIRMIDLFSGIGGFSLAAKMAWGKNVETVFFCERDKFCQAVLKKNFGKDIQIWRRIRVGQLNGGVMEAKMSTT